MPAPRDWFGVEGWSQGIPFLSGAAPDLAAVVRTGAAWAAGESLAVLHAHLPSVRFDERAQAHERGPAAVVEAQWRQMRKQAAEAPDFAEFDQLVEAAHAEPRLRQLYVFSSHWTLAFSSCTGYPFRVEVAVAPGRETSPYRVQEAPHHALIGEAATAEEAVALAVAHLPADVGPAVSGTNGSR